MQDIQVQLKRLAKGKKLLLVEDDIQTRDVLKSFLKEYFSLIKVAGDGDEAWKIYRQEHFDLVISDIEMPKTNGVMLSKGIKARSPKQIIIISSAYTNESYLVDLINIGIDGFLKKPVNIEQLYQTIVKALNLVQVDVEAKRVRFKNITKEVIQKDIEITKSPYQKVIEESETSDIKTTVKEFMEKIKQEDLETYDYLVNQKEILFDVLHDLIDNYELFAYRRYKDEESFINLMDDLYKLYTTLELFDKVKKSAAAILRLGQVLKTIELEDLSDDKKVELFDML